MELPERINNAIVSFPDTLKNVIKHAEYTSSFSEAGDGKQHERERFFD